MKPKEAEVIDTQQAAEFWFLNENYGSTLRQIPRRRDTGAVWHHVKDPSGDYYGLVELSNGAVFTCRDIDGDRDGGR